MFHSLLRLPCKCLKNYKIVQKKNSKPSTCGQNVTRYSTGDEKGLVQQCLSKMGTWNRRVVFYTFKRYFHHRKVRQKCFILRIFLMRYSMKFSLLKKSYSYLQFFDICSIIKNTFLRHTTHLKSLQP